jgi:lysozyme
MNDHLKLSKAGGNLIQHFEGCLQPKGEHYHAYHCPANVLTIGWGHTNHHGRKFDAATRWTREECDAAFYEDMAGFERDVRKAVRVPLEQWQFDSLVSFTYNCGSGALNKSTLLKKVNAQDWDGAAAEFKKWNKANGKVLKGLTRRRESESLLFQGVRDDNYDGIPDGPLSILSDPMPQQVDTPAEES